MKKTILMVVSLATALMALAEGYQVNTLCVKQEGMGHTGTAMKLGAESMIFNPAGMAFMDKTFDLSAGVSAVIPEATAVLADGKEYSTSADPSTPFHVSAAFSIYDNLKAGITINTPYGSGIDWTDNWPGSMLNQAVILQVFNVQPTVSYRILPNLSVGAGLMMAWGNVDLDKGLVDPATFDKVLMAAGVPQKQLFGNTQPASVNINGKAKMAFGYNVGLLWDINDKISVGASYRSKMDMKVEAGDATLTYANELAASQLGALVGMNGANFSAQMPAVSVLSVGVSYKPIEKLTLAFDAQLSGWSDYERLQINFLDDRLTAFNQDLTKNYKDSWAFRLGAQYALTERFDVRAGFIVDTTPVDENYFNPETPGMTRLEPCVGFSFRPTSRLSVDVAFTYIEGLARKGSNPYIDLVAAQAYQKYLGQPEVLAAMQQMLGPVEKTFSAEYDVYAFVPAIGISYSF